MFSSILWFCFSIVRKPGRLVFFQSRVDFFEECVGNGWWEGVFRNKYSQTRFASASNVNLARAFRFDPFFRGEHSKAVNGGPLVLVAIFELLLRPTCL
jgi:hypothetical protein